METCRYEVAADADNEDNVGNEEEGDRERDNRRKRRGKIEILFWNVAGLVNKDRDFWRYIREFDFVSLSETWVDAEKWDNIKSLLPNTHEWVCSHAKRIKKKGRAIGGFVLGRRKSWGELGSTMIKNEEEGLILSEILTDGERINIISVYNKDNWSRVEETIERWLENKDRERTLIGGDFNIRIGELGGGEEEEGGIDRKSKDKTIGNGGRNLVEWVQNKGWYILNGMTKGDWDGEYTFVSSRGNSVIDYVIVCEELYYCVKEFIVDARVDSDHMPVIAVMEDSSRRKGEDEEWADEEDEKTKGRWKICWDKEAVRCYKEKTDDLVWDDSQGRSIEEIWNKLKELVHDAMIKKEIKVKKWKIGSRDWWDRDCTRKKREVKRTFIKWRKGKIARERYIEEKGNMKVLYDQKRKKKREEEEKELKNLRHGAEIWRFINRKRKKKVWKDNTIGCEEWKEYFEELLVGTEENRVNMEERSSNKGGAVQEELVGTQLEEHEVTEVIRGMKKNKAVGVDGIPMEAWMYGGDAVRKGLMEVLKQVWREGYIPKDWRSSIIVPLYKRGEVNKVGNYRGISLLCSAYKIYAEIIRRRLEKIVEQKGLLPESQAGFRKGRSTLDNIFILDHLAQREDRDGKKDKVYAFFADLKAAFDNVDRGQLWKILREMGIDEELVRKVEEIYETTVAAVRTKDGLTEEFRVMKGVRQGCVLSPLLFSLYMADIGKVLKERGIGGIKLGKDRVWSLEYADDMVFLAKNREAMLDMLDTIKRFLRRRKMVLCTEKSKMMVYNKKGREKYERWKWDNKEIEEVKQFKYLGFVCSRNGKYVEHVKELCRKGRIAVNKVWGLGERICRNDFSRRWMLFKYLVQSVISYGVELWGWEERKELEKIMLDYVRWIFNLKFCTPRYMMSNELGLKKLRIGWGIRAMKYEEKIRAADDNRWIKMCWLDKEGNDWKDRYGRDRAKYFNRNGWSIVAVNALRREGRDLVKEMSKRDEDVQRQIEESSILNSRYNKRYKNLSRELDGCKYLRKEYMDKYDKGDSIRALANLRCGNMEYANMYWLKEENVSCIFCKQGRDNTIHYVSECVVVKNWFIDLGKNNNERLERLWNDEVDTIKEKILLRLYRERSALEKEERKRK